MSRNRRLSKHLLTITMTLLLAACAGGPDPREPGHGFEHDIPGEAVPWTHTDFDDSADKFTFAVFSDLTGGEREGVFAVAVEQLRLLRPEFIVNVGDLIEGGTKDMARLAAEWDSFDRRAGRARAPVFYTGGNHDLTNPVMWEVWEQRYGRRYYHFMYKDVLFLVLDTEDNTAEGQERIHEIREASMEVIEARGWGVFEETGYGRLEERVTGRVSAQQAAYFREVLAANPDTRWTFVLMHKPAWERPGEENFAIIEAALDGRPYTVFYGHEHAYLHQQRHGQDYIRLATTGGVQVEGKPMAFDHVTLVTVDGRGVDIANLRLSGILDKTGELPLNGKELCFELAVCGTPAH
ncbi:MAG: serine/threonine protein phosphatase [Xanthomonadales bacterium]|nr:metallophosphoesterase [Xanthomonadales bacterium]NIX13827.1 serine/threonine protein phosphatase [Xanthomonadales bacterium]